jgi:hypothetical protein
MLSIGNDELAKCPPLGKTIKCWVCGEMHEVRHGRYATPGRESEVAPLSYFSCSSVMYLCGIDGKEVRPVDEVEQ